MTTIKKLSDYNDIEILGLEPKDRTPHDYLRMVAKVFSTFRNIDPQTTVAAYLNGFVSTALQDEDKIIFNITKGAALVDDQFIAFTDDIKIIKDSGEFIQNKEYYLVLHYQYSTQYITNPATFEFRPAKEDAVDTGTDLPLLKFIIKDNLEVFPQNLDDKYLENYTKLFGLLENNVIDKLDISSFQSIQITADKLFVDSDATSKKDLSTKSGDVVFLDIDQLYKPAIACNRRNDKALGIYLYNPTSGVHQIVTNGMVDFSDGFEIHKDNTLLVNLSGGENYYLLDGCSDSNYAFDKTDVIAGKISPRFFPGTVRVGFAVDNKNFMVQFDFSADMDIKNIMEITGMPEEFQARFLIFLNYWRMVNNQGSIEDALTELRIEKDKLVDARDKEHDDLSDSDDHLAELTELADNPTTKVNISEEQLEKDFKHILATTKYDGEQILKFAISNDIKNSIPSYKSYNIDTISEIENVSSKLNHVLDNIKTYSTVLQKFKETDRLPAISETVEGYWSFPITSLPSLINIHFDDGAKVGEKYSATHTTASNTTDSTQASDDIYSKSITSVQFFTNNIVNDLKTIMTSFDNTIVDIKNIINDINTCYDEIPKDLTKMTINHITRILEDIYLPKLSRDLNDKINGELKTLYSKLFNHVLFAKDTFYFIDKDDNDLDLLFLEDINSSLIRMNSSLFTAHYVTDTITDIKTYVDNLSSKLNVNTSFKNTKTFIEDRNDLHDEIFTDHETMLKQREVSEEISLNVNELNIVIDKKQDAIDALENQKTKNDKELKDNSNDLIVKLSQQKSVTSLFYVSDYERKVYNYTYMTIRIRTKHRNLEAILKNIDQIRAALNEVNAQVIVNEDLQKRLEKALRAYVSVKDALTLELTGLVLEYNTLRNQFGIDDPVGVDQFDFDDYGLSDPNLECFRSMDTFKN